MRDAAGESRWDLPEPFVHALTVRADDIDAYDHVNNAVYVAWFDAAAWAHAAAVGMSLAACLELGYGMAVVRTRVEYLAAATLADPVEVATWITMPPAGLRSRRRFQVRHAATLRTLARAEIEYVCIKLASGRPARMPKEFLACYVLRPAVAAAHAVADEHAPT